MTDPRATTKTAADDAMAPTQLGVEASPRTEDAAVEGLPSSIGPYQVEAVLGRGGMGVVFAERVRRIDRQGHESWFHLDTDDPNTGAPAMTTAAADEAEGAR